jgi:DNA-binding CsgD family transcriptional regulator
MIVSTTRADFSEFKLTSRELEVLQSATQFCRVKEVAQGLALSETTVHQHLRRIRRKFRQFLVLAGSRTVATRIVRARGNDRQSGPKAQGQIIVMVVLRDRAGSRDAADTARERVANCIRGEDTVNVVSPSELVVTGRVDGPAGEASFTNRVRLALGGEWVLATQGAEIGDSLDETILSARNAAIVASLSGTALRHASDLLGC